MSKRKTDKNNRLNIPNEQILGSAEQFSKSVELLDGVEGVLWPRVINCAFACELYIKSLIAEEFIREENFVTYESPLNPIEGGILNAESIKSGHKLSVLLDEIFPTEREQVQKILGVEFSYLKELSMRCTNVFVDCRYPFENRRDFDYAALQELHSLLKDFASNVEHRMAYKNKRGEYVDVVWKCTESE